MAEAQYEESARNHGDLEQLLTIIGKRVEERDSQQHWNRDQLYTQYGTSSDMPRATSHEREHQESGPSTMQRADHQGNKPSSNQKKCKEKKPKPRNRKKKHLESDKQACHICNKPYKSISSLREHVEAEHEGKKHVCHICGLTTKWETNLKIHLRKLHNVGPEPLKKEIRRHCDKCNIVFSSNKLLYKHLTDVHKIAEPYTCPCCPNTFKDIMGLTLHKLEHPEFVRYRCSVCNLRFKTEPHFKTHCDKFEHRQTTADLRDFEDLTCYKCQKKYLRYDMFDVHIKGANTIGCFDGSIVPECYLCKIKFVLVKELKRHYKNVHEVKVKKEAGSFHPRKYRKPKEVKPKKEKCKVCGKMVSSDSTTMKWHLHNHEGRKDFKCDVCGYATSFPSQLRTHRKKHFGEKRFNCEVCQAGFNYKREYCEHMYTHKDTPPPKCSGCGKVFYSDFMYGFHLLRECKEWKMLPKSDAKDEEAKVIEIYKEMNKLQIRKRYAVKKAELNGEVFNEEEFQRKHKEKMQRKIANKTCVRKSRAKKGATTVETEQTNADGNGCQQMQSNNDRIDEGGNRQLGKREKKKTDEDGSRQLGEQERKKTDEDGSRQLGEQERKKTDEDGSRQLGEQERKKTDEDGSRQLGEQERKKTDEDGSRQPGEQERKKTDEDGSRQLGEQERKKTDEDGSRQPGEQERKKTDEDGSRQPGEQERKKTDEDGSRQPGEQETQKTDEDRSRQPGEQERKKTDEDGSKQPGEQERKKTDEDSSRQPGEQETQKTDEDRSRQPGEQERKKTDEDGSKQPGEQERKKTDEDSSRQPGEQETQKTDEDRSRQPGEQERKKTDEDGGKQPGEQERKKTESENVCIGVMPEDETEKESVEVGKNSVCEKRKNQGKISTGKIGGKKSSLKGIVSGADKKSSSASRGHAGNAKKRKQRGNSLGKKRSQSAWLCDDPSEDEDSDCQTSEDDADSDWQTSEDEDIAWQMKGVKNKKFTGGNPKKKRASVRLIKRKDRSSDLMQNEHQRVEDGDDSDWQPTERESKDVERLQLRSVRNTVDTMEIEMYEEVEEEDNEVDKDDESIVHSKNVRKIVKILKWQMFKEAEKEDDGEDTSSSDGNVSDVTNWKHTLRDGEWMDNEFDGNDSIERDGENGWKPTESDEEWMLDDRERYAKNDGQGMRKTQHEEVCVKEEPESDLTDTESNAHNYEGNMHLRRSARKRAKTMRMQYYEGDESDEENVVQVKKKKKMPSYEEVRVKEEPESDWEGTESDAYNYEGNNQRRKSVRKKVKTTRMQNYEKETRITKTDTGPNSMCKKVKKKMPTYHDSDWDASEIDAHNYKGNQHHRKSVCKRMKTMRMQNVLDADRSTWEILSYMTNVMDSILKQNPKVMLVKLPESLQSVTIGGASVDNDYVDVMWNTQPCSETSGHSETSIDTPNNTTIIPQTPIVQNSSMGMHNDRLGGESGDTCRDDNEIEQDIFDVIEFA
ncbi:uncharacterized protein [Amphiura filiformis]|uniref:uncharacterized protein n=1 Tax=Amphiura filiformis TaxID=82378 RepID=UPI003B226336